jgi:hypothetical protein
MSSGSATVELAFSGLGRPRVVVELAARAVKKEKLVRVSCKLPEETAVQFLRKT